MDTTEYKNLVNIEAAKVAERADPAELYQFGVYLCERSGEVSEAASELTRAGAYKEAEKLWKLHTKIRRAAWAMVPMSDFAKMPMHIATGAIPSPAQYWADARIKA